MSNNELPAASGRRRFLARLALGAAVIPLARLGSAEAADLPHLSADDPTAKALGYVEAATKVDPKAESMFKAGSHCGNCALFQSAQAKLGYGPCAVFAGKAVNQNGWCRTWSPAA